MSAETWGNIFNELAAASPYALLLVLGFVLFYWMHKHSLSEISKYSQKTIDEIRRAYDDSARKLSELIAVYFGTRDGGKS